MIHQVAAFAAVICWALAPRTGFAVVRTLILLYAVGLAPPLN
jgi:hypothetical protein